MEKEEKVLGLIIDFNNDIQSRQHGGPTNPFEKQKKIAELYPFVAINHLEDFYTDERYYPEETRENLDEKKPLINAIDEIRKNASYTQDLSAKKAEGMQKAA